MISRYKQKEHEKDVRILSSSTKNHVRFKNGENFKVSLNFYEI